MKKVRFFSLVGMIAVAFMLTGCGAKKIEIMDYVTVNFSGVTGKGTASAKVELPKLEEVLMVESAGDDLLKDIINLEASITVDCDKTEELSNGDTIHVTVGWNEATAKAMKIDFGSNTRSYTVENLPEAKELDVFDGVEVTFEGMSGMAEVDVDVPESGPLQEIYYRVDKKHGLKNGDIVTITVEFDEESLIEQGYVVKVLEHTYTVENLPEQVDSVDDLSDENLKILVDKSRDEVLKMLKNTRNYLNEIEPFVSREKDLDVSTIDYGDMDVIKMFLYVNSNPRTFQYYNRLVIVFETTVSDNTIPEGKTVYIAYDIPRIMKLSDGTLEVEGDGWLKEEDEFPGMIIRGAFRKTHDSLEKCLSYLPADEEFTYEIEYK